MPDFASSIVRSAPRSAVAGFMSVATVLAVCIAGVSALAATASMICTVIIAVGPVPPLVDQWQRVRIVQKVLDKVDSVDDAAKLLQALAPASWAPAQAASGSKQP
jgi:hypothetical protein